MTDFISWRQFRESAGVEDWRNLSGGAFATYPVGSLGAATAFVAAIGELPGIDDRRPAIDIRNDSVTIRLVTVTEASIGMSQADVEVARTISALARSHGLAADPLALQSMLVCIGTPGAAVLPFWRAVLGYEPVRDDPENGVSDPRDRGPAVWVETMDEPRGDGGGAIHLAIWVPHEIAEVRVAAALAAGGRLVRDSGAPAWWTLADAAGNEVDIATTLGRD